MTLVAHLLLIATVGVAAGASAVSLTHSGVPAVGLYGPNRYDGIPDDCLLPMEFGYCRAKVKRYYFDVRRMKCAMFFWGGCAGNLNNFKSLDECNQVCLDAYEDVVSQSRNSAAATQVGQQRGSNYNANNANNNNNNNNNANIRTISTATAPIASAAAAAAAAAATSSASATTGGFNSKYAIDSKGGNFKSYLNKFNNRGSGDNNNNNNNANINLNNNNNKNTNNNAAAATDSVYAASEDYDDDDGDNDAEEEVLPE